MGKNSNQKENLMNTITAVEHVHENVEKSIRRTWSNRGFNGWWLNSNHGIALTHTMYPQNIYTIGDRRKPHTMAEIVGAKSPIHAIVTYEMRVGVPLGMIEVTR